MSVLTWSAWGINAAQRQSWSSSLKCCHKSVYQCNLFWNTGEPNETVLLKHSQGWEGARGQMWLSRATLWLCHDDITTNVIRSQPWPSSLWLCPVLILLPTCFPSLFLLPHCRLQHFGGTACAWQHSTIFPDPHLLPWDHQEIPACIRIIKVLIFNSIRAGIKNTTGLQWAINHHQPLYFVYVPIERWEHHENIFKSFH